MPARRESTVRLLGEGWDLIPMPTPGRRRAAAAVPPDDFITRLAAAGPLELEQTATARRHARRGAAEPPPLDLAIDSAPGELRLLAVRHASGAITFHLPLATTVRRGRPVRETQRFQLTLGEAIEPPERRGPLGKAAVLFVLKIVGEVAERSIPALARTWESAAWRRKGLREGLLRFTAGGGFSRLTDPSALAAPPQRNLLLIHGTFSNAVDSFGRLAHTAGSDGQTLFAALGPVHGDRIFAFNHFTVSRSPEQNARALLEALPDRPTLFDSVTHSRGGLVLRHLAERRDLFGGLAERFQLGRAVLVASPNEGTPLASPSRCEHFLTWLANLLDFLPEHPFTVGLEFLSQALAWLARRAGGALAGLAAMDSAGPVVAQLQAEPHPPAEAYSALVANYEPDAGLVQRMADAGLDVFFGSANDLVVPTEGGWRVDPAAPPAISGSRIGCFGRGGNLPGPDGAPVHHTNFFSQPATVDFLVRALRGDPQPLPPLDPGQNLPFRGRRGAAAVPTPAPLPAPVSPPAAAWPSAGPREPSLEEVFHICVLAPEATPRTADLMATFRNARVLEKLDLRGGEAGRRWHRIIAMQERIRNYIEGKPGATDLPHGDELVGFGQTLFETLFPGGVRRLYDVARAAQGSRRLNLVFTSMVDWIADKPWEFAYDPGRDTFLATEEINLVRNVLTAIPADRIEPRAGPLRILVVVAQPLGTGHLSVEEETEVIRSGFRRLTDAGLAEVEVLVDAYPARLHRALEASSRPFDALHFIGHGAYDPRAGLGYLIFENEQGGLQRLDSQVFRQIVCRRDIRLIFLNACETGRGGTAEFNRGVAPALVAGGVPAVVANQYSVLDTSATSFARHFYWALAQGRSIGEAAREARVAVNYSISGEAIDWAVPVVYARDPTDALCPPREGFAEETAEIAASRLRRGERTRTERVALWDIQRVIPRLDRIAETLTAAQGLFGFEAVYWPAPLGTWRRETTEGVAYLHAPKVAQRLAEKPAELGVDRLIAIANLLLRDDETLNLYFWGDPGGWISIFSTAGLLEQLRAPELTAERMIVNAVAASLAGLPSHSKGDQRCALYFNPERDIRLIAGPLRFCAPCARKLRRAPARLAALERLLRVY